jgi:5-methylcytosine-specific restriction endonuclease McrA
MHFRTHLWTSALAAAICYRRSPGRAAALVAAGTLIDIDHLALYALRTGDRSLVGALVYDQYRNHPRRRGDNRPRYGSLRSWLHEPALIPPLLLAAALLPWLRPVALGLALHQALDHTSIITRMRVAARAGGRCELCGATDRPLAHHPIVHPFDGGRGMQNLVALCEPCRRRARDSYPVYPPVAEAAPR